MKPADWQRRTFSQKVAWRGVNPDPRLDYRTWADKYRVKDIVRPYFGVAETYCLAADPLQIDAGSLPATYVMKATHGWDMCMLVVDGVVKGGNRSVAYAGRMADTRFLQSVAHAWFTSKYEAVRRERERHYTLVQPGILFERFLDPIDHELQLFLFNGRCRFAMVFYRGFFHQGATHRLYDERWRRLEPGSAESASLYEREAPETPRPPAELTEKLAGLCRSIDHVRADFYVCGGQYYFSEFTFTHNSGDAGFIGRYDAKLGRHWLA